MTAIEVITKEDLKEFKNEMLKEMRALIGSGSDSPDSRKWLKGDEVLKLLRISKGTLQGLRNSNKIRFTKIGQIIYYKLEDVYKMLEEGGL